MDRSCSASWTTQVRRRAVRLLQHEAQQDDRLKIGTRGSRATVIVKHCQALSGIVGCHGRLSGIAVSIVLGSCQALHCQLAATGCQLHRHKALTCASARRKMGLSCSKLGKAKYDLSTPSLKFKQRRRRGARHVRSVPILKTWQCQLALSVGRCHCHLRGNTWRW